MTTIRCPACGKPFSDGEAMKQHFADAHRKAPAVTFNEDQVPPSTIDDTLPDLRCENCRYWGKGNNLTVCRRNPGVPAMVQGPAGNMTCISLYPPALPNEWCGEWAAKGDRKAMTNLS